MKSKPINLYELEENPINWLRAAFKRRIERIEEHIPKIPIKFAGPLRNALTASTTANPSIKAHCQQCVNYEETIANIRFYSATLCPI